jgi:hypothetical protein
MPAKKPYTHVQLLLDKARGDRFEIRTSTYVEFDEDPGRRSVTGNPSKKQALDIAKEIARRERAQRETP